MKKFMQFAEAVELQESINTPIEFHLTDDTLLPFRIHGAFKIDDDDYGMSLEQSDFAGIYILSFYRILAKQKRLWAFKKPSHIRQGLSTLLKFAESVVPFVKVKMKGIIIKVPGQAADRYIRFATRLLKKSYITSFRVLPVAKNPDKKVYPWENIFMSRVGVSPSSVFSDKKFKKYYNFEVGDLLTSEMSADIKPLKKSRNQVRTEPSKRFVLKDVDLAVDLTIDDEILDKVTKVEKKIVKKALEVDILSKIPSDILSKLSSVQKANIKDTSDLESIDADVKYYEILFDVDKQFKSMIGYLKHNLDLDRFQELKKAENKYDLKQAVYPYDLVDLTTMEMRKKLKDDGYVDPDSSEYEFVLTEKGYSAFMKALSTFKEEEGKDLKQIVQTFKFKTKTSKQKPDVYETNLDPDKLISSIPGVGIFNYDSTYGDMSNGYSVKDEDVDIIQSYVMKDLGYTNAIENLKHYETVKSYTSSGYKNINASLRNSFLNFTEGKKPFVNKVAEKFASAFDDIPPLEESLWVYRSTDLPYSIYTKLAHGEEFMDPGALSTTIRSTMNFGGNQRFRIFLPKGSKVIPILNLSNHINENEVILPPMSVLKIIRIDDFQNGSDNGRLFYTAVFVGSVYKEFMEKVSNLKESFYSEAKRTPMKKSSYNPADKFKGTTDEKVLLKAIEFNKSLKKGKKSVK